MDGKKDPGKFTVRFNVADPQQLAAIRLLNQQGRCKAQFLSNAILYYAGYGQTDGKQSGTAIEAAQIEQIVKNILSEQQCSRKQEYAAQEQSNDIVEKLDNTGKDAIFQTLQTFRRN